MIHQVGTQVYANAPINWQHPLAVRMKAMYSPGIPGFGYNVDKLADLTKKAIDGYPAESFMGWSRDAPNQPGHFGSLTNDGSADIYVALGINEELFDRSQLSEGGHVSCWCKTDSVAAGLKLAFSNRDNNRIYLGTDGSATYTRLAKNAEFATHTMSTGIWYLLSVTWDDSGNGEAFVNGESVGTTSGLSWSDPASQGAALGAYWSGATVQSSSWNGNIGTTIVHDRYLSPYEVAELYHNGPAPLLNFITTKFYSFGAAAVAATQTMPIVSSAGIHSAAFHGLVINGGQQ